VVATFCKIGFALTGRFRGGAFPRAKDDMSRQLAAPAAKLSARMKHILITGKSLHQEKVEEKSNRVLKLGLDVHYRQVTVAMQEEAGAIKAVGRMGHDGFEKWVERKREAGW